MAAPADVTILKTNSEVLTEGYKFDLETSEGTVRQETGKMKNIGKDDEAIVVRDSFSWVADYGQTYTVKHVADENGFHPQGAHFPVVPVA